MKFTKKDIPLLLLFIGTFVFPYILRERLIGQFALINLPVWFALFYAYQSNTLRLSSEKVGKRILLPYLAIAILLLFLIPGNGWSIKRKILLILIYLLPAVFIFSDISDESCVDRFVKTWLSYLRIVCVFMCLCQLADMAIGEPWLQQKLADFYVSDTLNYMISQERFVSYLGHPLESTYIFLMLLVWSTLVTDADAKPSMPYLLDVTVAMFGIFVCASKAAVMLAAVLLVFNCLQRRNIREALLLGGILLVFWLTGITDLLIARLSAGDITTGRSGAFLDLIESGLLKFNFLKGHIFEYDNVELIAALENPFLGWSFTCGIVFAVLQYLIYFVYPGLKVLFSRKLVILVCILILMAYPNANNGLYSFNDDLLIYSLNIWLILQVTKHNHGRIQ